MSGKYALIIGNTEYSDPGLAQLTAPGKDAEDFARVLKDQDICGFDDVNILLNQPEYVVRGAIDEFFDEKRPDDLLVFYFSGHGVRDELGALYLAVKNTIRSRLRSTAIKSDYVRETMEHSRSKRQVLILDCCNSGAFEQGTKAATGVSIGTATAFEAGYGRIILTASDSTQFAWEGDKVIGETDNSLFTHFLVEGLQGNADRNGDGQITVDELYDYAYEKVKFVTPKQTPSKFSSKQQGEIILRQITRLEDIRPVSLPDELIEATKDSRTFVREGAIPELAKLLQGKNLGLARSAREVLERMEREDDSRRVSQAATQALEPIRQAERAAEEESKGREGAEHIAAQKAEEEWLAQEKAEAVKLTERKAEAERRAREEAERLLAKQNVEEERRAREEAERLAILKAEDERLAVEKAEAERKAKQESARLLAEQQAQAERIASKRLEKEAERPAAEEVERKKRNQVTPAKLQRSTIHPAAQEVQPVQTPQTSRLALVVGVALALLILAILIFRGIDPPLATATEPPAVELSAPTEPPDTQAPASVPEQAPTKRPPTRTPLPPTEALAPSRSAPIIDFIDFPATITCDGSRHFFWIYFQDADGDAYQIDWELIYSKLNTNLDSDPREFFIDEQTQQSGAVFEDWIEWYVPGDEVRVRIHIFDTDGSVGSKDFEFTCSS